MSADPTRLTCPGCRKAGVEMLIRVGPGKSPRVFRCPSCIVRIVMTTPAFPIGGAAGR